MRIVFRILENVFVKLSCSWRDLIINPPFKTVPKKFAQSFFPHLPRTAFLEKGHTLGGQILFL